MWDLYLVILKISEKNVSGITSVQNWHYLPYSSLSWKQQDEQQGGDTLYTIRCCKFQLIMINGMLGLGRFLYIFLDYSMANIIITKLQDTLIIVLIG